MALLAKNNYRLTCVFGLGQDYWIDPRTKQALEIPAGVDLRFEIGIEKQAKPQIFHDLTDVINLKLEVKKLGVNGQPPDETSNYIFQDQIVTLDNATLTSAQWEAGTHQHATFDFANTDTNWYPDDYWLVLSAEMVDGSKLSVSWGKIKIVEDGTGAIALREPLPVNGFIAAQVSGAEISAGTELAIRAYSPADIVSFILIHGDAAGATNLTWDAATSTIQSSTGSNAIITLVDGTNPGLMSVADKADVTANTADRHTHANKVILDAITAAFTTADQTTLGTALQPGDVINTLVSVVTNKPLSAAQGKVLKDLIDALGIADIAGLQAALDAKAALSHTHTDADINSETSTNGQVLTSDGAGNASWQTPTSGVTDHTLLTNIGTNTHAQIDSHIANTSNPHGVTAAQIGALTSVASVDITDSTLIGRNILTALDAAAVRALLALGTAALSAATDFATAAQGALADSATQPGDNISTLVNDLGFTANPNAIETDQAGELAGLTLKGTPVSGDILLIEDSENSNNKKYITVGSLPTGGGGEVNTASNLGVGTGVFAQKSGIDLQFKSLVGGTNISLSSDANTVTITNDYTYTHPNHTGDVTSTGDGATVITNNAVTLAKLQDMATASFIGRNSAGTGDPEVLTAAIARTILNVADGATANSLDSFLLDRVNHTGTQLLATISDAGTSAGLNVPAAGNAAVGEVVKGDDTRLSDPRTPTAHTHTAVEITDFDTEVSNNTSVVANTAKVSADGSVTTHSDVTSAGSGQIITATERTTLASALQPNSTPSLNAVRINSNGYIELQAHSTSPANPPLNGLSLYVVGSELFSRDSSGTVLNLSSLINNAIKQDSLGGRVQDFQISDGSNLNGTLIFGNYQTASPATPPAGTVILYSKGGTDLFFKTDAGTVIRINDFITATGTNTLTNKTIDADSNTLTNLEDTIRIACSDFESATDLTVNVDVAGFTFLEPRTIYGVAASLKEAATGSTFIVDVKINGSTILSTPISIDASELSSLTAATQPVLTVTPFSVSAGDRLTIDRTQVGSTNTGRGLTAYIQTKIL